MGLSKKHLEGLGKAKAASSGKKPKWRVRPEILLQPPLPLPMHGLAPRVVLGKEWWDEERAKAKARTDNHCEACGKPAMFWPGHPNLEGHERYDIDYLDGRMVYLETVPLCWYCHNFIHIGRLQVLIAKHLIPAIEYNRVLTRGNVVLARAKLTKADPFAPVTTGMADWADWRLVIGDLEYPPLFASLEEYHKKYKLEHDPDAP